MLGYIKALGFLFGINANTKGDLEDIEDDEGVFKKIQSYLIRYFRPEIKKITDVVEKTQKNKM